MTLELIGIFSLILCVGIAIGYSSRSFWRDIRHTSLVIERDQLQVSADGLCKERNEAVSNLFKAREANGELNKEWKKTAAELRDYVAEKERLLRCLESADTIRADLERTIAGNDEVKSISEARIRELEAELKDVRMREDLASEMAEHAKTKIDDMERQLSAEAQKVQDEKCRGDSARELLNDRSNRISELENSLQTIKDCIDDEMSENFVAPRGSEAFG